MSSPENSPIFTTGAVYTQAAPSDSLWGKITDGLGNVLGGLGNYAREALPYIAQAASAYGNAMSASSPSTGTAIDNSNPLIYQPSNVNLPYVTPLPITPVFVNLPKPPAPARLQTLQTITRQLRTGINPARTVRINLLNALAAGADYPTQSQPSATNAQVSPIQASQGSLLSPQPQNAENSTPPWIQEPPYSTQGAQQPVSYAQLYQDQGNQWSQSASLTDHQTVRQMKSKLKQLQREDLNREIAYHQKTGQGDPKMIQALIKAYGHEEEPATIYTHRYPTAHNQPKTSKNTHQFKNHSVTKKLNSMANPPQVQTKYISSIPIIPSKRKMLLLPDIKLYKTYPSSWMLKEKVYPDVTHNQRQYIHHIVSYIRKNQPDISIYFNNFWPKGTWDLKGQPGIPPTGHWALYKGQIISDAYLANNAYGHAMAAAGITLPQALNNAEYANFINPVARSKADQPEDQAAIISGWLEEYTGDPWPTGLPVPFDYEVMKSRYPKQYQDIAWHFQQQSNIKKLLDWADRLFQTH